MQAHGSLGSRALLAAALTVGLVIAAVPLAQGNGVVDVNDVEVMGAGPPATQWDPDDDTGGCETSAYSPVDDGSAWKGNGDEMSDAFDGGLTLRVAADDFLAPEQAGNDIGRLQANPFGLQVRVGPTPAAGLRVLRADAVADAGSAAMRTLIRFRNPTNAGIARNVMIDSELGADNDDEIRATSNGDTTFQRGNRWVVTSDDANNQDLSDPALTFVLRGRGNVTRVNEVVHSPDGTGCMTVVYRVRVPANSSRFLMLFTELSTANTMAINQAQKYDNMGVVRQRMARGVPRSIRNRTVNWNL